MGTPPVPGIEPTGDARHMSSHAAGQKCVASNFASHVPIIRFASQIRRKASTTMGGEATSPQSPRPPAESQVFRKRRNS